MENTYLYSINGSSRRDAKKRLHSIERIRMLFVVLAAFLLGACLTGFIEAKADKEHHQKYFTNITIMEGDTLWSIARENCTEEYDNLEDYITEVREINHLCGDSITEGRHIVIPHYTTD